MNRLSVRDSLLTFASDDYTGLWVAAKLVRQEELDAPDDVVMAHTLDLLRELISEGLIELGQLSEKQGADHWSRSELPVDEAIDELREQWRELGRDPNPADFGWLTATSLGDEYVRTRFPRRK